MDRIDLHFGTTFGDVDVQPLAGTPLIVVHGRTVFGDLRLRSVTPGQSPCRWRALLDRLARRPGQ